MEDYDKIIRRYRRKRAIIKLIAYTILLGWTTTVIYPVLWVFFMSLKSNQEIFASPWTPPTRPLWENYIQAVELGNLLVCMRNSAIVTILVILVMALIAPMAAYVLARSTIFGRKSLLYLLLIGMFIAPHVTIVPLYSLLRDLGLIDTYLGLVVVYVSSGLPYCIFIIRSAFMMLPKSLEEAAKIDGLSTFQIYWRIMLPLARPAILVALILEAIFVWNDFLYPLVFLRSKDLYTIPLGLVVFRGMYLIKYGPLSAGLIISALPMIIFYMVFSKYIRKGVAAWMGIKG